jgi:cysteine-rich repeat protein
MIPKVVFWDSATGAYADTGCTAVSSSKATQAVADCYHLTDFGTIFVATSNIANPILNTSSMCGNSVVEHNEECDDGNLNNGDGCSSTCTTETSAIDKVLAAISELPIVGIAIGAGAFGLLLIAACIVGIKRKHGRILFCFKSAKVAPTPAGADLKQEPSTLATPDHSVAIKDLNSMSPAEYNERMTPAALEKPREVSAP